MTSVDDLDIRLQGDVIEVVLNRPSKRNALTRAMLKDFLSTLQNLPAGVRMLVLSAAGPAFCAGMDLQEMQVAAEQPDATEIWKQDSQLYREVLETLFSLPFPTVCQVHGPVFAGGVGLVLACDIVLATEGASFSLPEPKRGITASIVLPFLRYRIGAGPAGFMLLSGLTASVEEAARWGLVHQLIASDNLKQKRQDLLQAIRSGAPQALAETKRQLQGEFQHRLQSELDAATLLSAAARGLPEAREGLQAFLERRSPSWASDQSELTSP